MPSDPALENTPAQRLHPASLFFSLGSAARNLLLPGIAVLVFSRGSMEFLLMVLFLPSAGFAVARYLAYRYRVGTDELIIQDGILTRNERHIPYARIQNIDLRQNVLHRLFGVAEARLETASGNKPEATIRVLSLSAIEELRAQVFAGKKARAVPTIGVDPDAPGAAPKQARVLLHLPTRELALFGVLTNRGLALIAAAMGLFWQIDIPGREEMIEDWVKQAGSSIESAVAPSRFEAVILGLIGAVVVIVVFKLLSMAWTMIKFHDFTLRREGEDLRSEYGLLTRVSATIPRDRIQLLSTRAPFLYRWRKRAAIQIETAGASSGGGQDGSSSDKLWLAPFIHADAIRPLLEDVLPDIDLDAVEWRPIHPRARRRLIVRWGVVVLIVGGGAVAATGAWGLLVPLIGLPLAVMNAVLHVRHAAYAVTDRAVLYRSGWWIRRMSVVRFTKIQSVSVTESPFDRRHRMASLRVDTAGGGRVGHGVRITYLDGGDARGLLQRLSHEAGSTSFSW